MALSMDVEAAEDVIERLQREVQHVSEQAKVSHRMAQYWKAKYRACEVERAHLEKQLKPKAEREAHLRHEERQSDVDARFGLFAEDEADDAPMSA